jgi:hypothetical protein
LLAIGPCYVDQTGLELVILLILLNTGITGVYTTASHHISYERNTCAFLKVEYSTEYSTETLSLEF